MCLVRKAEKRSDKPRRTSDRTLSNPISTPTWKLKNHLELYNELKRFQQPYHRQLQASTIWMRSEVYGENIHSWLMPLNISQSRLADRMQTSSACTFIAIMAAKYLFYSGRQLPSRDVLNESGELLLMDWLLQLLANAILEGNDYHDTGMRQRETNKLGNHLTNDEHKHFSIPEVLSFIEGATEIDWIKRTNLFELPMYIQMAVENKYLEEFSQLFFPIIIHKRAFLVSFDRDQQVIFLIDGHAHQGNENRLVGGAYILMGDYDHLKSFCQVVFEKLFPKLNLEDELFEISCIQLRLDGRPPKGVFEECKPRPAPRELFTAQLFPKNRTQN